MLDDFRLEQPIIYNTLINSIKLDKVSHAYLIETNGYYKSIDLALALSKTLLCKNHNTNNNNCKNCNQCKNIDNKDFLELKIIEPEGQWIKKTQLDELQEEFSKKSIIGDKKIYIINGAEKLNVSSSNSLLKFLEEPEEGIIAILLTENISLILPTIVSRCQILSLNKAKQNKTLNTIEKIGQVLYNTKEEVENYISNTNNKEFIEKVIQFIEYYEENKLNTIIYINKLWNNYFKEKTDIINTFQILILFYKDVLNIKIDKNVEIFNDYIEIVNKISKINNIYSLTQKINVLLDLKEKIKFNINNNMLMDKLIIELERCDER